METAEERKADFDKRHGATPEQQSLETPVNVHSTAVEEEIARNSVES
jgi:hypothetical protein